MIEYGVIVNVSQTTAGTVLSADAAAGATVIDVQDASDFDEIAGGSVSIGGSQYTYSGGAVDNEADTISLDTGLVAAASDGDRVDAWDAAIGAVVVETRALVSLPGLQGNDDSIDAIVSQSLVPLLAEGLRDPGAGESVTLEQRGDEWVIIDVRGKRPSIQPGYAGGAAVEAIGYAEASDTSGFTGAAFDLPFDTFATGTTAGFFAFVTSGGRPWVQPVNDGMYYAHFGLNIHSALAGDTFQLVLDLDGGMGSGLAYGIADSSGNARISAATAVDFASGGSSLVGVTVSQISGTGTTATLSNHELTVVKLAGGFPA